MVLITLSICRINSLFSLQKFRYKVLIYYASSHYRFVNWKLRLKLSRDVELMLLRESANMREE